MARGAVAPAAAGAGARRCGGCSFSYQLDNMFSKKDDAGSAPASLRLAVPKAAAEPPAEGDLAFARAAASEVLTKGGKDASMPWENPSTGARGTITPLASAYSQDGTTCRDFLASYVRNGSEVLAAGRGLPRRARQVGSAQDCGRGRAPDVRKSRHSDVARASAAPAMRALSTAGMAPTRAGIAGHFRVAVGRRAPHIGQHEGGALPGMTSGDLPGRD